jgi:2',3'-cyclic-nucleotide 2'-phosphodiesterase
LTFRLMFIGDVVGEAGRAAVSTLVPVLRRELELDAVVANGKTRRLLGEA